MNWDIARTLDGGGVVCSSSKQTRAMGEGRGGGRCPLTFETPWFLVLNGMTYESQMRKLNDNSKIPPGHNIFT